MRFLSILILYSTRLFQLVHRGTKSNEDSSLREEIEGCEEEDLVADSIIVKCLVCSLPPLTLMTITTFYNLLALLHSFPAPRDLYSPLDGSSSFVIFRRFHLLYSMANKPLLPLNIPFSPLDGMMNISTLGDLTSFIRLLILILNL